MKFWLNNRLDGTFEVPIEQIVAQFRESAWWTADLDLDSAVRGFLLDTGGPVSRLGRAGRPGRGARRGAGHGLDRGAGERHTAVA